MDSEVGHLRHPPNVSQNSPSKCFQFVLNWHDCLDPPADYCFAIFVCVVHADRNHRLAISLWIVVKRNRNHRHSESPKKTSLKMSKNRILSPYMYKACETRDVPAGLQRTAIE